MRRPAQRALGCLALAAAPALAARGAAAGSLDFARRLETLPAARWLEAPPAPVMMGVARPVTLGDARAAWLEVGPDDRGALRPRVALTSVRAGALRESGATLGLRAAANGLAAGLALQLVQTTVVGVDGFQHLRGSAFVALTGRHGAIGGQFEGPWRNDRDAPRAQSEWSAKLSASGWAVGVSRRSSRYGAAAAWRLGLRAEVAPALALAFSGSDADATLMVCLRMVHALVRVAVPVVSPIDAGPALEVGLGARCVP